MDEILAISLRSMHADMARLEQVAMNLANVSTLGYKRGLVVQTGPAHAFGFATVLEAAGRNAAGVSSSAGAAVSVARDTRAGTLRATGQSLDVAIVGDGYFEVLTDSGPAYTRQGSFRVDARGRLVTAQGHAVQGTGGDIVLNTASPLISLDGRITEPDSAAGAVPVGQLRVVRFAEGSEPQPVGDGLFAVPSSGRALGTDEVQVRQGYLENSNVNSAHEMTQLMLTMRHFETMQRVVQSRDQMLESAVRKLGESP